MPADATTAEPGAPTATATLDPTTGDVTPSIDRVLLDAEIPKRSALDAMTDAGVDRAADATDEQRERAAAPPKGLKGKALARYILTGEHVQQQVAAAKAKSSTAKSAAKATDRAASGPREGSALAAAVAVLKGAKSPLTVQDIYDRAKARNLVDGLKGKTPVATLGAQLATANKKGLYVERPAPGRYQLRKSA